MWNKGQGKSQPVTGSTGVNGLTKKPEIQILRKERHAVMLKMHF